MSSRPIISKRLNLLWFLIAAALCTTVVFATPEHFATMSTFDVDEFSRYGAIGKLVGSQLSSIDTAISKLILITLVVAMWAVGKFVLLCVSGLANLAPE